MIDLLISEFQSISSNDGQSDATTIEADMETDSFQYNLFKIYFCSSRSKEVKLILSFISNNERYDPINGKKLWSDIQDTFLSSKMNSIILILIHNIYSIENVKNIKEAGNCHTFFKTIIRDIDSINYDLADNVIERFRAKCKASKPTNESKRTASSECESMKASPYFLNELAIFKKSYRGQRKTSGYTKLLN